MIKYKIAKIMAYTPTVNEAEAKNMINAFVKPLTSIALWAIPIIGLVAILVVGVSFLMKSEEEREQKPITVTITKMIKWIIMLELIPAIFKIVGL